jgi:hypothetical protein
MRRGRFNPKQKRDSHGRWTSGGGSSFKSGGKLKAVSRARKPKAPKTQDVRDHQRKLIGNAIGAGFAASKGDSVLAGIHAVGVGTAAYRLGSNKVSGYVNQKGRFNAKKRATFNRRKAKVDAVVGRVEKAQNIALAGHTLFGLAATAAGVHNAGRAAAGQKLANGPRQLGRTALKAAKQRRGVHKITTL